MTNHAKSGHPGGALGAADLLTVLFFHTMHIDPDKYTDTGIGEDVFFLSNGHLSALFYSILARRGYFDVDELSTFRKLNSRLQGHPASVDNYPWYPNFKRFTRTRFKRCHRTCFGKETQQRQSSCLCFMRRW
jgi:transketolase